MSRPRYTFREDDPTAVDSVFDRGFFARNPHRRYRVRRSSPAEVAGIEHVAGGPVTLLPGFAWFTTVRNIAPGKRLHAFLANDADAPTALSDEQARHVWSLAISPEDEERAEAQLKAMEAEVEAERVSVSDWVAVENLSALLRMHALEPGGGR